MNRIFKVIWSDVRKCYVVVGELANGFRKNRKKMAILATIIVNILNVCAREALARQFEYSYHYTFGDQDVSSSFKTNFSEVDESYAFFDKYLYFESTTSYPGGDVKNVYRIDVSGMTNSEFLNFLKSLGGVASEGGGDETVRIDESKLKDYLYYSETGVYQTLSDAAKQDITRFGTLYLPYLETRTYTDESGLHEYFSHYEYEFRYTDVDSSGYVPSDQTVNGNGEYKGDLTTDKDLNVKGEADVQGPAEFHDDVIADKNIDVQGDSHTEGNSQVDGNETVGGELDVQGDTHTEGNSQVDGNETVGGELDVQGDTHTEGNSQVDGNETVGGELDVQGDFHAEGNSDVDGDLTVDKSLDVKGHGEFEGSVEFHDTTFFDNLLDVRADERVEKNLEVDGDTTLKGKVGVGGTLDVQGDTLLHSDLHVEGTSDFDGQANFHDDVHFDKNISVGGDSYVHGSSFVDQSQFVGGNELVLGDTFLGGGLFVQGPAIFGSGLSAGGNKITDVADGRIAPDSMDAVNGRQLYQMDRRLTDDIKKSGAHAAALAALKTLDYDPQNPTNFNVGYGNYRGASAVAVGLSHYFTEDVMFNAGTTIAEEPMLNAGLSIRLGKQEESISSHMGHQKQLRLQEEQIQRLHESTSKQLQEKEDEITLLRMKLHMVQDEIDDILGLPTGLYGQQKELDKLRKKYAGSVPAPAAKPAGETKKGVDMNTFDVAYVPVPVAEPAKENAPSADTPEGASAAPDGALNTFPRTARPEAAASEALDGSVDWISALKKQAEKKAGTIAVSAKSAPEPDKSEETLEPATPPPATARPSKEQASGGEPFDWISHLKQESMKKTRPAVSETDKSKEAVVRDSARVTPKSAVSEATVPPTARPPEEHEPKASTPKARGKKNNGASKSGEPLDWIGYLKLQQRSVKNEK